MFLAAIKETIFFFKKDSDAATQMGFSLNEFFHLKFPLKLKRLTEPITRLREDLCDISS